MSMVATPTCHPMAHHHHHHHGHPVHHHHHHHHLSYTQVPATAASHAASAGAGAGVLPPPRSYYVVSWVPRALPEVVQLIKEIPSEAERCLINKHFELGMLVMRRCGVQNPEEIKCLLDGFREGTTRLSSKDSQSKSPSHQNSAGSQATSGSGKGGSGNGNGNSSKSSNSHQRQSCSNSSNNDNSTSSNNASGLCCSPTVERRKLLIFFNDHRASRPWVLCPAKHCIKSARTTGKVKGRVKILQFERRSTSVKIPKLFLECLSDFLTRDHYVFATFCPQQKYTDHELEWFGYPNRAQGNNSTSGNTELGGDTIFRELVEEHDTKGSRMWPFEDYIIFSNSQAKIVAVFKKKQPLLTLYRHGWSGSTSVDNGVPGSPTLLGTNNGASIPSRNSVISTGSEDMIGINAGGDQGTCSPTTSECCVTGNCHARNLSHYLNMRCSSSEISSDNAGCTAHQFGFCNTEFSKADDSFFGKESGAQRRKAHTRSNETSQEVPNFIPSSLSGDAFSTSKVTHPVIRPITSSSLASTSTSVGDDEDDTLVTENVRESNGNGSGSSSLRSSSFYFQKQEQDVAPQPSPTGGRNDACLAMEREKSESERGTEPNTHEMRLPGLVNERQIEKNILEHKPAMGSFINGETATQNKICMSQGQSHSAGDSVSSTPNPYDIRGGRLPETLQNPSPGAGVTGFGTPDAASFCERPLPDAAASLLGMTCIPSHPFGGLPPSQQSPHLFDPQCFLNGMPNADAAVSAMTLGSYSTSPELVRQAEEAEMVLVRIMTRVLSSLEPIDETAAAAAAAGVLDSGGNSPYVTGGVDQMSSASENSGGIASGSVKSSQMHNCDGRQGKIRNDGRRQGLSGVSLLDDGIEDNVEKVPLQSQLSTGTVTPTTSATGSSDGNYGAISGTSCFSPECIPLKDAKCNEVSQQQQQRRKLELAALGLELENKRRKVSGYPSPTSAVLYHELVRQFLSRLAFGLDHPPMPQKRIPDTVKRVVTKIVTDSIREINLALLTLSIRCSPPDSLGMLPAPGPPAHEETSSFLAAAAAAASTGTPSSNPLLNQQFAAAAAAAAFWAPTQQQMGSVTASQSIRHNAPNELQDDSQSALESSVSCSEHNGLRGSPENHQLVNVGLSPSTGSPVAPYYTLYNNPHHNNNNNNTNDGRPGQQSGVALGARSARPCRVNEGDHNTRPGQCMSLRSTIESPSRHGAVEQQHSSNEVHRESIENCSSLPLPGVDNSGYMEYSTLGGSSDPNSSLQLFNHRQPLPVTSGNAATMSRECSEGSASSGSSASCSSSRSPVTTPSLCLSEMAGQMSPSLVTRAGVSLVTQSSTSSQCNAQPTQNIVSLHCGSESHHETPVTKGNSTPTTSILESPNALGTNVGASSNCSIGAHRISHAEAEAHLPSYLTGVHGYEPNGACRQDGLEAAALAAAISHEHLLEYLGNAVAAVAAQQHQHRSQELSSSLISDKSGCTREIGGNIGLDETHADRGCSTSTEERPLAAAAAAACAHYHMMASTTPLGTSPPAAHPGSLPLVHQHPQHSLMSPSTSLLSIVPLDDFLSSQHPQLLSVSTGERAGTSNSLLLSTDASRSSTGATLNPFHPHGPQPTGSLAFSNMNRDAEACASSSDGLRPQHQLQQKAEASDSNELEGSAGMSTLSDYTQRLQHFASASQQSQDTGHQHHHHCSPPHVSQGMSVSPLHSPRSPKQSASLQEYALLSGRQGLGLYATDGQSSPEHQGETLTMAGHVSSAVSLQLSAGSTAGLGIQTALSVNSGNNTSSLSSTPPAMSTGREGPDTTTSCSSLFFDSERSIGGVTHLLPGFYDSDVSPESSSSLPQRVSSQRPVPLSPSKRADSRLQRHSKDTRCGSSALLEPLPSSAEGFVFRNDPCCTHSAIHIGSTSCVERSNRSTGDHTPSNENMNNQLHMLSSMDHTHHASARVLQEASANEHSTTSDEGLLNEAIGAFSAGSRDTHMVNHSLHRTSENHQMSCCEGHGGSLVGDDGVSSIVLSRSAISPRSDGSSPQQTQPPPLESPQGNHFMTEELDTTDIASTDSHFRVHCEKGNTKVCFDPDKVKDNRPTCHSSDVRVNSTGSATNHELSGGEGACIHLPSHSCSTRSPLETQALRAGHKSVIQVCMMDSSHQGSCGNNGERGGLEESGVADPVLHTCDATRSLSFSFSLSPSPLLSGTDQGFLGVSSCSARGQKELSDVGFNYSWNMPENNSGGSVRGEDFNGKKHLPSNLHHEPLGSKGLYTNFKSETQLGDIAAESCSTTKPLHRKRRV